MDIDITTGKKDGQSRNPRLLGGRYWSHSGAGNFGMKGFGAGEAQRLFSGGGLGCGGGPLPRQFASSNQSSATTLATTVCFVAD